MSYAARPTHFGSTSTNPAASLTASSTTGLSLSSFNNPSHAHTFEHLTNDRISRLDAQEAAIELDRLDQDIVRQLQEIDANFVKSYRTLTDRILPDLEKYGQASKGILESAGFWKTFFETSAGIRLTDDAVENDDEGDGGWAGYDDEQEELSYDDVDDTVDEENKAGYEDDTIRPRKTVANDDSDEDVTAQLVPNGKKRQRRTNSSSSSSSSAGSPRRRNILSVDQVSPEPPVSTKLRTRLRTTNVAAAAAAPPPPTTTASGQTTSKATTLNKTKTSKSATATDKRKKGTPRWSTDVPLSSALEEKIASDHQSPPKILDRGQKQGTRNISNIKGKGKSSTTEEKTVAFEGDNKKKFDGSIDIADDTQQDDNRISSNVATQPDESLWDSPEIHRPELETMRFDKVGQSNHADSNLVEDSTLESIDRPVTSLYHQPSKNKNNQSSATSITTTSSSTPKAHPSIGRQQSTPKLPKGVDSNWDGLTDLSKTPLSSLVSPAKRKIVGTPAAASGAGNRENDNSKINRNNKNTNEEKVASSSSRWDETDDAMSPPLFMSINRSKLAKTPGKEAAKLVTRDVLMSAALRGDKDDWRRYRQNNRPPGNAGDDANDSDSGAMLGEKVTTPRPFRRLKMDTSKLLDAEDSPPIEPPSVVKNWEARGYGNVKPPTQPNYSTAATTSHTTATSQSKSKSPLRTSTIPNSIKDDDGDGQDNVEHVQEDSFGAASDLDDYDGQEVWGDDDYQGHGDFGNEFDDDEDDDNSDVGYDNTLEAEEIPMEDDTLFGGRQSLAAARRKSSVKPSSRQSRGSGDVGGYKNSDNENIPSSNAVPSGAVRGSTLNDVDENDDVNSRFPPDGTDRETWLKGLGPDEMHTLHGGDLLQSQPFEHSPLAGKDWRGL